MKIPDDWFIIENGPEGRKYVEAANHIAAQISMETGIFVSVTIKNRSDIHGNPSNIIHSIVFAIMDHEFDSGKQLKKALDNKAFL